MLDLIDKSPEAATSPALAPVPASAKTAVAAADTGKDLTTISGETKTFAAGEMIFEQGARRTHFIRIEKGAVRHDYCHDGGNRKLVEFAFAGDAIGLGFLEQHVTSAQAMVETEVVFLPMSSVEACARADANIEARLAAAIDIEFAHLRDRALRSGVGKPVERIAAFLLAVSSMAAREGGEACKIPDTLGCGYVAGMLSMSVDGLADGLKKLERRGLVKITDKGLELRNIPALEMLADEA